MSRERWIPSTDTPAPPTHRRAYFDRWCKDELAARKVTFQEYAELREQYRWNAFVEKHNMDPRFRVEGEDGEA